jgi:hypothetical protein
MENDMADWFHVGEKCKESLPLLHETWNEVCSAAPPLSDTHPLGELRTLLWAAILIGQHAIYSAIYVERYARAEASNTYEDYVQYYLYNFIGRVMSASDILGLLVNHVYELSLGGTNGSNTFMT